MLFDVAILLAVCGALPWFTAGTTYQDETEYFSTLMSLYTVNNISMVDFIAHVDSTEPRIVRVQAGLLALQDMDEVSGTLEMMMSLTLTWTDDIVPASGYNTSYLFATVGSAYKVESLLIPHNKIWTPELVLINAVDTLDPVGGKAYKPRYYISNGAVTWNPMVKVRSACSADVTYYPFDKQTCSFQFIPWGRTSSEITFQINKYDWETTYFEENGEWNVVQTSTSTYIRSETPALVLSITIERKPLYFAFNILLPVIILVVLNGMVFWLPVESGERIGFSVTCFLSFVVFLNMIMDILPRSSSPMSYLCYYTVCMMIFSGTLTAVVILQMRLFHKPNEEKVPRSIQNIIRCLQCKCHKKNADISKSSVTVVHEVKVKTHATRPKSETITICSDAEDEKEMTWPEVTRFLVMLLFLLFVGGQTAFTLVFVAPIGANA